MTSSPLVSQVELFSQRVKGGRSYLILDNRVSGEGLLEVTTVTCCHCNRVVYVNESHTKIIHQRRVRQADTGLVVSVETWDADLDRCPRCHAYICDSRGCHDRCTPVQQSLVLGLQIAGRAEVAKQIF